MTRVITVIGGARSTPARAARVSIRAAALALAVACAATGSARASTTTTALGAIARAGSAFTTLSVPVRLSGQVVVSFHGDQATGCAAHGLCGYSGTVTWQPARTGEFELIGIMRHGRARYLDAFFGFNNFSGPASSATTADVQLSPLTGMPTGSSDCLDVVPSTGAGALSLSGGQIGVSLHGVAGSLLGTRCAGPRDDEVARELPALEVPVAALTHAGAVLSLAVSRAFSSDGFAGTIDSTVRLTLGHAAEDQSGGSIARLRRREVAVRYRAALAGRTVDDVSAASSTPICSPLGACGLTGTMTAMAPSQPVIGTLYATASSKRPLSDLLAAVGLRKRSQTNRLRAIGIFAWRNAGTIDAVVHQGPLDCVDSAPLQFGYLALTTTRTRLVAEYDSLPEFSRQGAPTGCPGPSTATAFVTGSVPLSDGRQRLIRIHLSQGSRLVDDGYTGTTTTSLTLTLTRLSVRSGYTSPGSLNGITFFGG